MDQDTRNTLRSAVTKMRRLLEDAIAERLEGRYGIYASGEVDGDYKMGHLTDEEHNSREILLGHLEYIKSSGIRDEDAVDQLKREIAFTHLNRLVALKLMEKRGLIEEAVSRGTQSRGVQYYLRDNEESAKLFDSGRPEGIEIAYRNFLIWQAQQFQDEINVLFSPYDPANVIYPPQRVLDEVLEHINSNELELIWTEDETIGWVYQYFTPIELRKKTRDEITSGPRNSYELAFLNQFYTPRYVVEFLTDNTLGRTWYEMYQGNTALVNYCDYLMRHPNEIFLEEGEEAPEIADTSGMSQEELLQHPVYIPFRAYKDPRRLKVLDPACGSGHFLLYCFDLLVMIYEEAWDQDTKDPLVGMNLRQDFESIGKLRHYIPQLILKHNLHGIDIDRRATQIAALALWLKAQRYYHEHDIKASERPKVTQGNIVVAEPMPGDKALLQEFTATLSPKVLGQLVERVFDKMKLAGDAGSLLKIEESIQDDIKEAKELWETGPTPQQMALFPDLVTKDEYRQLSLFDVSTIDDAQFWSQAEKQVIDALETYAQEATNGRGLQRRLFADDAAGGFTFIEMLRKKYDVVLMNPPFGAPSAHSLNYFRSKYPIASDNLLIAFQLRFHSILNTRGMMGAITDRSFVNKKYYKDFREQFILDKQTLRLLVDLGWGVLDGANVEVAMFVHSHNNLTSSFSNLAEINDKIPMLKQDSFFKKHRLDSFRSFPNFAIVYDLDEALVETFDKGADIEKELFKSFGGLKAGSSDHLFRLIWEVPVFDIGQDRGWAFFQNGSPFAPYYFGCYLVVRCDASTWETVMSYGSSRITNSDKYFQAGLSYGKRTDLMYAYVMRGNQVPSMEGHAIYPAKRESLWKALLIANSAPYQEIVNHLCGQHKYAGYVNTARVEPQVYPDESNTLKSLVSELENMDRGNEVSLVFIYPESLKVPSANRISEVIRKIVNDRNNLSERVNSFRFSYDNRVKDNLDWEVDLTQYWREVDYTQLLFEDHNTVRLEIHNIISYALGVIFGRWDIEFVLGNKEIPQLPEPFDALQACPPGMLQTETGYPATPTDVPDSYPINIEWTGIIVDDPKYLDDIIRRIRDVFYLVWGDNADPVEQDILDLLKENSLRSYFRKQGNSGFFSQHIGRYSKGRRRAPIYWYLQSNRKNYGLWFYYHRLDKDFLYKALMNYVIPKITLETQKLEHFQSENDPSLQADISEQQELLAELDDFRAKLQRAAELELEPDLNDGVVLNIAPLYELVPWSEAEKYWNKLMNGEYEWSSISQQLRAKGLLKEKA